MKVIRKILLSTMLSLFAVAVHAEAASATPAATPAASSGGSDVSGTYQCQGYDPFGKSNYSYPTVTIAKNGDAYTIQWQSSTGYPLLLGTGLFNHEINNAFAVVFWDPKKADYFGTAIYLIKPDGTLQADWTLQAQKQIGTETCTKVNK